MCLPPILVVLVVAVPTITYCLLQMIVFQVLPAGWKILALPGLAVPAAFFTAQQLFVPYLPCLLIVNLAVAYLFVTLWLTLLADAPGVDRSNPEGRLAQALAAMGVVAVPLIGWWAVQLLSGLT